MGICYSLEKLKEEKRKEDEKQILIWSNNKYIDEKGIVWETTGKIKKCLFCEEVHNLLCTKCCENYHNKK